MKTNNNEENSVSQPKYEELLSISEKNKRIKQNILWKNHPELVDKDKFYYTEEDKKLIKQLLYNPIPPEYRSEYWFISTGAKLDYKNNKGYYEKLKNLIQKNPNFPFVKSITLDMHRTFPQNAFFKDEENLTKLNNILKVFALRNCSSIGYCQGFNYIAAQLLYVLKDEEKTFWCFTNIVEDYLPLDFYLKFTGVRVDMAIMQSTLVKKLDFINKNEELKLCINNLISRCFISLYSEIVEIEILHNIWDIFFIYGEVILFRTFNFIAFVLCDKKFKKHNIETVHAELTQKLRKLKSNDLLNYFLLFDKTINDSYIKKNRKIKKNEIYKQNKDFDENYGENGVTCDINSPFCFYNKIINNITLFSEYKIFRLKNNTKRYDNYFSDMFEKNKFDNKNDNNNNNNENVIKKEISIDNFDDILIERMKHVCKKENQTVTKTKEE